MSDLTAVAFRAALTQRLRNEAARRERPVASVRKRFVARRFLARLLRVAPDRVVLKGGLALDIRLQTHARSTQDMDLVLRDTEETALGLL